MIHISENLRNSPFFFLDFYLPEMYSVPTLSDLVRNVDYFKPTRCFLPPGIFYLGQAAIFIETSLVFASQSPYHGELTDLNESIAVRVNDLPKFMPLEDGQRIFSPMISMDIKDKELVLRYFKYQGPKQFESATQDVQELVSRGAFGF
jgi:hypothetical protein